MCSSPQPGPFETTLSQSVPTCKQVLTSQRVEVGFQLQRGTRPGSGCLAWLAMQTTAPKRHHWEATGVEGMEQAADFTPTVHTIHPSPRLASCHIVFSQKWRHQWKVETSCFPAYFEWRESRNTHCQVNYGRLNTGKNCVCGSSTFLPSLSIHYPFLVLTIWANVADLLRETRRGSGGVRAQAPFHSLCEKKSAHY